MITLVLLVCAICKVHGQLVPLIYAAPSAVSHQSRVDITHTPGFISAPLIYSPATTLYSSHQVDGKAREAVVTPVFASDTILTPVALSFFHNLPLARALEHPISIDKMQQENEQNDEATQNMESVKSEDEQNVEKVRVMTEQDKLEMEMKQKSEDKNVVVLTYDNNDVTTHEPKVDAVTEYDN